MYFHIHLQWKGRKHMYCPNCKKDMGEDALFCPECGTKTLAVSSKRCNACQAPLAPDMAFCPECGQPVAEAPYAENPGYNPGNYQQNNPEYAQQSGYQQQKMPDPMQNYSYPDPSAPLKKKAPVGAIVAICAGVLVVCAAAIFLLSKMDKNDAEIVSKENQTAQEQKDSESAEDSSDIISENTKKEKKKEDQVVQVIENNSAEETGANGQNQNTASAQSKTFTDAKDRTAQQNVLTIGAQLDLQHMGNLLGNTGATYGAYILDVTNLQEYDVGSADTPLPASALIGVPILFTIADGVDKGEINLDTPVTLAYTFANGRGVFKSSDNGRTFPISQMLSEALTNSDNNALNSLIDFLTLDRINTTCHSYGFNSVDMQRKLMTGTTNLENYISAKDAAMMLNTIYQDNFIGIGKAFLETNFKISGSDTANRGMYPACNSCETFLNLNGITDSRYNEIGLIQNGDEVFIISVFTCNGVANTSASALTTLSSYVVSTLKAQ